jgi:hypothetical protein
MATQHGTQPLGMIMVACCEAKANCACSLLLDRSINRITQTHVTAPGFVMAAISGDQQQIRLFLQGLGECLLKERQR